MAFSENLTTLRKNKNLSQEQLAEMLGVTRQAISKWESGQSMPDAEKLLQLSDIFHVTVDQLLTGLQPFPQKGKEERNLYTLLSFIGLAILWFTGLVLVIVNVFFNQGPFQVYIWYESLAMMLFALLGFIGMLVAHHLRNRKEKE